MAGTVAAAVLAQQGRRVVLLDLRSSYPPVFKAEKINQEQVILLRKFGLLEHLLPYAGGVRAVQAAYDGRVFRTISIEQYGINYQDMVNALRTRLPAGVECRLGRVTAIASSQDVQRLTLADGGELRARLVVLANGVSTGLQQRLGLRRHLLLRDQSLVFGFSVAAAGEQNFSFDSVTYYSIDPSTCIDYLTLFKIRDTMRANLFVFRGPLDPWVRAFVQQPEKMLRQYLPKLERVTGAFRIVSAVESGRIDLFRMEGDPPPGVAMIGDCLQSVCPSTGLGLDKVLTDVDALAECVPRWFASPGMGREKLAKFYRHPRKLAMDAHALQNARSHRQAAMDPSLRWRIHRFLLHRKWQLESAVRALRG